MRTLLRATIQRLGHPTAAATLNGGASAVITAAAKGWSNVLGSSAAAPGRATGALLVGRRTVCSHNHGSSDGSDDGKAAGAIGHPELADVLKANRQWTTDKLAEDPTFFDKLGKGQSPDYLWIGCSDSRVPANQIAGMEPGDVFVHRNVGNLVCNSDLNCQSVIEYAVGHLDIKHIIVAGHYDCGAVKASLEKQDLGLIEHWVRNIRDVHRLHAETIAEIKTPEERSRKLVELNVVEQCLNVYKTGVVQRRRLETSKDEDCEFAYPRVHAVVFDPCDGKLIKLPVSFKNEIKKFSHVYDLYDTQRHWRSEGNA